MPHPSHTDLYSMLDPCAINHHRGKEGRGGRAERRRGMTRKRQIGGGKRVMESKKCVCVCAGGRGSPATQDLVMSADTTTPGEKSHKQVGLLR